MDKKIIVSLLANAGLMIQYDGYTILLDALQKSKNAPFSPLPSELWQAMLNGDGEFSRVDALMFTHLHPDHFSSGMTLEYLQHHEVPTVMMPEDVTTAPHSDEVIRQAGSHFIPIRSAVRYCLTSDISVIPIKTRHLDPQFYSVPHYCFLISFGAKNILVTADIDYTYETLSALEKVNLDAVFINPLFFSALRSERFFKGQLKTKKICVYHIPFASDDKMNFRAGLETDLARWKGQTPVTVLDRPMQQIEVG